MRRAGPAVAALLGLWLAAWTVWTWRLGQADLQRGERGGLHVATGYTETADLFLRHDWLAYDPARGVIVPRFPAASGVADFYRHSYLRQDVEAFNAGDKAVFRVDNGRLLALDPSLHNLVLPFAEPRSWPGELTFRPETGRHAWLAGGGVRIELSAPTHSLRQADRLPQAIVRPEAARGAGRAPGVVSGEAVNVLGEGGAFFGKTHLLGASLLFNHRGMSPGARISISGEEVPPGNHARLDSGDLLKLEWQPGKGGSRYALLWSGVQDEAPVISSQQAVDGLWRRLPAEPEPRLAGSVLSALDGAYRRLPVHEPFDLALTLDQRLQEAIERRLVAYARRLHRPGEPPFRAAVTVMDATNGELLALASYPRREDLEELPEASRGGERLLRNHNFSRLPVGSVAKVMLSAAILDAAPYLADLKIRGYAGGELDQVLGISLDPPLRDHAVGGEDGGWIGFEEFLEKSSNKYAATLLTLATAADRTGLRSPVTETGAQVPDALEPGERFELGGRVWDRRPAVRLPLAADPSVPGHAACGLITTLEHEPHALALTSLFGVPTAQKTLTRLPDRAPRRLAGSGDDLIDTSLWLPLLDYLYGGSGEIPVDHPFFIASPERPNLAYNLIDDFRRQYLSVILGGASSTWTNVDLCQAFSRLATGRQIDPFLVRRIRPWNGDLVEPWRGRKPLPALGLSQETRSRLLNALTRVAGPAGTASRLDGTLLDLDRALAAEGKVLGFFSKTGSPEDAIFVPSRTALAVDALIRSGALHLDPAGAIAYRDAGAVGGEAIEEAGSPQRALAALLSNPTDLRTLRRYGISPRLVVRLCAAWNRARRTERGGTPGFQVRQGQLVHLLRAQEVDAIGATYVFTMGIYPGAARLPGPGPRYLPQIKVDLQPERALSVAIAIEGQGNGPDIAVPFARQLIQEVLWDALRQGW